MQVVSNTGVDSPHQECSECGAPLPHGGSAVDFCEISDAPLTVCSACLQAAQSALDAATPPRGITQYYAIRVTVDLVNGEGIVSNIPRYSPDLEWLKQGLPHLVELVLMNMGHPFVHTDVVKATGVILDGEGQEVFFYAFSYLTTAAF